jgi:SET domain-containing protein
MIFLAPSAIHGVGVFTDASIVKGVRPDLWHPDDLLFVPRQEAHGASYAIYCVETKDGYWCPRDFRCMSLGWYMNHSDTPSLIANGEDYIAASDIAPGEELTVDYVTLDAEVDNRIAACGLGGQIGS